MDNKSVFLEKIKTGDVFFFAGSGISYMSLMPSAGKVLCKTSQLFLPQDNEFKIEREKVIVDDNKYTIQSEVFYENLLYLTNSLDSILLWKCLSPNFLKNYSFPIAPNINHLFIVDYSVRNKVPIFTTNFDCLFESAANELNYNHKIILPYTEDERSTIELFKNDKLENNTAYIFKLHGSISIGENDSIATLFTTMNSISKVNFTIINFLQNLCNNKYIVFAGYSGKDIDYFPEIKKRTLKLKPFWIDKFHDIETKNNCEYIKASEVLSYPNEIFMNIKPEFVRNTPTIKEEILESIFNDLHSIIKERVEFNAEDKKLLLGLLLKEVGEYKPSYSLLLTLYRNNYFNKEKETILLINLSKLAHENSKYESCHFFAKEALRVINSDSKLESYTIISLCQISESRRMLIAHDISFFYNINYIDSLFAIISFIKNSFIIKRKSRKLRSESKEKISYIFVRHDSIEHKIRFYALLQAIIKPIIDQNIGNISNSLRSHLERKWQNIRAECAKIGYSHGIANSFKFQTRINKDIESLNEGEHIYDLTTAATGKGLALRNRAEYHFENKEFDLSKKYFYDFFDSGIKSGNNLNAIKGLFGIAKCNKTLKITPLLEQNELYSLKKLMFNIEGKNWQKYFSKILNEIEQ